MIVPTIGRIVWFLEGGDKTGSSQPHAAIVTYVWGDRFVNLAVFNPNGVPYNRTSVRLLQDNDTADTGESHAEWMPFQREQAKKHDYPVTAFPLNPAAQSAQPDDMTTSAE
jgi:hypothetical protein